MSHPKILALQTSVPDLCYSQDQIADFYIQIVGSKAKRRERALRAILNYGHTFGHAFEALAGYGSLLHGEAVSIGMICASRLAESLGRISAQDTRRQIDLLAALKLPINVPAAMQQQPDEIVRCMMLDKKTEGRELRFVLPSRIGHVETVRGILPEVALRCL